jgi:hypothetical protein
MALMSPELKTLFSGFLITTIIFIYIVYHGTSEEKMISTEQHLFNILFVLMGALQAFG